MKLSVIIVNYNVEHFLEQCLHSVRKATKNMLAEVFVVDNNSVDGSVAMIKQKFPEIKLIENKTNTGFSFANNQAIKIATGEYILLLNPDTIVEEDTFVKCAKFMDERADAGGLGVKMIDGKGNFLPESKRGLPTPAVAFFKIFGFARVFPSSKIFGKYHLGFLNRDENHSIEILSGAYMMMRKTVLDKVGLLDEDFFMYGEDVDLSYRIIKAGYKNYYYSGTRIIHYKGESTKKSSVNYVFVFYNAMIIFARKHFSQGNAKLFSFFIKLAIYLRAAAAIVSRFIKKIFLPLVDSLLIYCGFYFIKNYYEHEIKSEESGFYPPEYMLYVVPTYIFVWLCTTYLSGGYDKSLKISKIVRGIVVGTIGILVIYALLPESLRFSRALILIGAAWAAAIITFLRITLHLLGIKNHLLNANENKRIAIVGDADEFKRVNNLLKQTHLKTSFVGQILVSENTENKKTEVTLGNISQLQEAIDIYKIDEVIFCAKDVAAQIIIDNMLKSGDNPVDYKIAPPESLSVIGSNSIDTSGDLYTIDINSISKPINKRNKRIIDITVSTLLLLLLPILFFIVKNPFRFLGNIFTVGLGLKTWVGIEDKTIQNKKLTFIKPGIILPSTASGNKNINQETADRINMLYAKDYRAWNDLTIIFKAIKKLGS
jgi:GT2 family glycosyltransferase